jgi:hypothetical protein
LAKAAKAGRKRGAAAQQSKRRQLQQQDLGTRSEFEDRAERREWKERLCALINTRYSQTPLQERQWWRLRDLADEYARSPGTAEIDNEKRGRMVDFLCRAIYRSEFKDRNGRMQVANLYPSPLSPFRLDVTWLDFDQLLQRAFDGHLFIRRSESIECFGRNNIDVPTAWLPSELAGPDVPGARNLTPTSPPVEEHWKIIEEPRRSQRELRRARAIIRQIWPGGPPRSMSIQQIANRMKLDDPSRPGGFAATTVKRALTD